MGKYEKFLHWMLLLAFLGLATSALAANYFFSKEAIMDSFKSSLPMLNLTIPPVDQLFISRIARRDTWDIHFYFGLAFVAMIILWLIVAFVNKNYKNIGLKVLMFGSGLVTGVSGIWLYSRIYYPLTEDNFALLKNIHHIGFWSFIGGLSLHVAVVIYKENKGNVLLSNMMRFTSVGVILVLSNISVGNLYAENDLSRWTSDNDYIQGMMYLNAEKGYASILREISNCPYEKCKAKNVDKKDIGLKKFVVKKPDYKKAIELLKRSSDNGNAMASDKLLRFLTKRIDYKSKFKSGYLLKELKKDTGLDLNGFNNLVKVVIDNGVKTNKSCYSEYLSGEMYEYGLFGNKMSNELAIKSYKKASEVCPKTNFYQMVSIQKFNRLKGN